MFSGEEISTSLVSLGVTHVVWLPDSMLGRWESALEACDNLRLVRVCREGEAWPLAAGLYLGGKTPVIMMQTTGLFESGDALRNTIFDFQLPLFAIIGARNWLVEDSRDTAKTFAEPILRAWSVDFRVISSPTQKHLLKDHYRHCQRTSKAGVLVIGEGKE